MNKKYFAKVFKKILETCISVKVLTIASILIITTFMVYDDKMDAKTFASFNGTVISVVYALREAFKVQRIKEDLHEDKKDIMI